MGVMVYLFPPLFGEGYSALTSLLNNDIDSLMENSFFYSYTDNNWLFLLVLLAIVFLKAFATSITCASGGVGGTFAPSLFIGGFVGFFVATGIGQLPATSIYSYVGGMLTGGAKFVVMGLLILFSLSVLSVMLRQIYKERVKKRAEAGNGSAKQ